MVCLEHVELVQEAGLLAALLVLCLALLPLAVGVELLAAWLPLSTTTTTTTTTTTATELLAVWLALLPLPVGVGLLAVWGLLALWLALLPLAPLAALEGLARPLELRFLVQVLVLCLDLDQLCAASGLHEL